MKKVGVGKGDGSFLEKTNCPLFPKIPK